MNQKYPFENPPLPYGYRELEPFIDEQTLHFHHDKHLQTYVDNLNAALAQDEALQSWGLEQLILGEEQIPESLRTPIKNNAGGVYNHIFYFEGMAPHHHLRPEGELKQALHRAFGGYDEFWKQMKAAALGVFGSGYAWLCMNPQGELIILKTANQETPLTHGLCPILAVDVWEHAYYLKNQNRRGEYLNAWAQVIDWKKAEQRYLDCMQAQK